MTTVKEAIRTIEAIKSEYDVEVIKDYDTHEPQHCESKGFGVQLRLNLKYDYDNETLESWRKQLHADSWYIHVRSNQLFVMFIIHTNKGGNQ